MVPYVPPGRFVEALNIIDTRSGGKCEIYICFIKNFMVVKWVQ